MHIFDIVSNISDYEKENILKNINLNEDQFIIDAGAYIGTSSIRFSQLFKKNKSEIYKMRMFGLFNSYILKKSITPIPFLFKFFSIANKICKSFSLL